MQNFPRVSIIIPNYNDAKSIQQSLHSVLNQNYPNIETIIIDDGSTDNSLEVIKKYIADGKVKLIARKENKGTVYSLNQGIANASGEYINLFSANDYFLPGFISKSMDQLIKNPDIGISCTDSMELRASTETVHGSTYIPWIKKPTRIDKDNLPKIYKKSFLKLSGSTCIMKTDLVRKEGGLKENLLCSCDWYLVTKIAFSTGLIYIPEQLMTWTNVSDCYSQRILKDKEKAKYMYSNLLDNLSLCDKDMFLKFKRSGELGCILKFAASEILKRPKFWSFCPTAIKRYLKRSLKKAFV